MATRKPKRTPLELIDDTPRCELCTAGRFETKAQFGECRFYPQTWCSDGEGGQIASHDPASRSGWCRQFERKTH